MANWNDLKAAIINVIKSNGNQEITGLILQAVLNTIVNNLGQYASFAGIATPATKPGTPDGKVYYIASEAGIYANFNGKIINAGEVAILWNVNGTWEKLSTNIATKDTLESLIKPTKAFLSGGENVQRDKNTVLIPAYLINGEEQSEDSLLLEAATEFEAGLMTGDDRLNMNNLMEAVFPLQVIFEVSPKIAEYDGGSCPVTIDYEIKRNGGLVDTPTVVITKNGAEIYRGNENKKQIVDDAREKVTKYYIDAEKGNLVQGEYITIYRIAPMYFGFNSNTNMIESRVFALNKQDIKSTPTGTYLLANNGTNYMWLCIPEEMDITNVTLNGFDVPMEDVQTLVTSIGTYRCYRSSNMLIADSYPISIKGTSTIITGEEDNTSANLEDIENLKKAVEQNANDILELQENGAKSIGNYINIGISGGSQSGTDKNIRIVNKDQLLSIKDYIDKLETKYPRQYQFNGTYLVSEYASIDQYTDILYNKMRIYHVGTYYRMSLTAQDINMSTTTNTGKGRIIIRGIEFAFNTNDIQENTTIYVKEAQCDVISVPEQELAQDGDMKYKNVYKVLANDGTYKAIKDILGVDIINTGNGDKFLSDNGQYIKIENTGGSEIEMVTLTINATPAEATIKINDVEQKTVTVEKGTQVNIEVTYEGYKSYAETITVNEDTTKEIILEPLINKEELDMNVYKVWTKLESGAVKFDTTATETIKAFLTDINAGNLALLYMTQPMSDEPQVKDYIQMMVISYSSTQFSAIGFYQAEFFFDVGSLSQYIINVNSDSNNGYTATYNTITADLTALNFNALYNLPLQYRTKISYSSQKYKLSNMNSSDLEEFISNYYNNQELIAKAKCYLTITEVTDINGSPTEVPFDIYPDVYNKNNIGGSGVILHGVSRNADTQGRRLELEISGDTGASKYTITKCRYVDNSGSPIE